MFAPISIGEGRERSVVEGFFLSGQTGAVCIKFKKNEGYGGVGRRNGPWGELLDPKDGLGESEGRSAIQRSKR